MIKFGKRKIKKFKKAIKRHFLEVAKIKTSANSIAVGFALGTFISILPTPGLNILIGVLLIAIFEKINKFTLFSSILFWNTLTLTPFYILSYKIGNMIFASSKIVDYKLSYLGQIWHYSRRFIVGNFITAVTISILIYILTYYGAVLYKRKIKKDKLLKKEKSLNHN